LLPELKRPRADETATTDECRPPRIAIARGLTWPRLSWICRPCTSAAHARSCTSPAGHTARCGPEASEFPGSRPADRQRRSRTDEADRADRPGCGNLVVDLFRLRFLVQGAVVRLQAVPCSEGAGGARLERGAFAAALFGVEHHGRPGCRARPCCGPCRRGQSRSSRSGRSAVNDELRIADVYPHVFAA
jgi:hypothetical protein